MAHILIVEDNEMNADMLSRRLRRRGFEVSHAMDGEEGISMVRELEPDLVLMDLNLPRLDGWEATRRLKADPSTATIPVVALTANAMRGDRDKALAVGCEAYATKPIDFPSLLETVGELLGTT